MCQFLLCNKVNQLHVYIYPHIPSLLSLLPTLPISPLLGGHKAPSSSLCAMQLLLTSYLFYIWQCIHAYALSLLPSFPFPDHVLKSIFYIFVIIPVLPLGSSEPFFFFLDSIYMCQHTVFVFLFLTYFTLYDRLQVHPPHYK